MNEAYFITADDHYPLEIRTLIRVENGRLVNVRTAQFSGPDEKGLHTVALDSRPRLFRAIARMYDNSLYLITRWPDMRGVQERTSLLAQIDPNGFYSEMERIAKVSDALDRVKETKLILFDRVVSVEDIEGKEMLFQDVRLYRQLKEFKAEHIRRTSPAVPEEPKESLDLIVS